MADLSITQELPAPPERVWRAWTAGDDWTAWFWPARFDTGVVVDPQVGGLFHLRSEPMSMGVSGEYLVFDEPSTLDFTWRWDGEIEQTRVLLSFAGSGAGTTLTLQHTGFHSDSTRDEHLQGWRDCLGRLIEHLT